MKLVPEDSPEASAAENAWSKDNKGTVFFRSTDVYSLPILTTATDPAHYRSLLRLELEKQGLLNSDDEDSRFDFWISGASEGSDPANKKTRLTGVVLSEKASEHQAETLGTAKNFDIAARRVPLSEYSLGIWKESKDESAPLLIGYSGKDGRLIHFQALTERVLNEQAAQEIDCILKTLALSGHFEELRKISLFAPLGLSESEAAFELLRTNYPQAELEERELSLREGSSNPLQLLPSGTAAARSKKIAQSRNKLLAAALLGSALLLIGGFWGFLFLKERELNKRSDELSSLTPRLAELQETRDQWNLIERSVDPQHYAIEIINRCAYHLPPRGIEWNNFQLEEGNLVIAGEANNVDLAMNFREKLVSSEALASYDWEFPQPSILSNNRARFRAEATQNF